MSVVNKDKTGELGLETLLNNMADGHTTPIPREPLPATGIKSPGETPSPPWPPRGSLPSLILHGCGESIPLTPGLELWV